jgi:hypothetical protein
MAKTEIGNIELTEKHRGRYVQYVPQMGEPEIGRIKSWTNRWVFVVYHCDDDWDNFENYTAAATDPKDLRLI